MKVILFSILLLTFLTGTEGKADSNLSETTTRQQKQDIDSKQTLEKQIQKLQQEISTLKQSFEKDEQEKLRREAEAQSVVTSTETINKDHTVFTSANRALQSLNPEISVVVDTGGTLSMKEQEPESLKDGSEFYFRTMGIHFETNLDPFSFFKAAIGVSPSGVSLGEAYATWTEILPYTSLTLGKFRQQFGAINRWHIPSLDQWDQPLALSTILGAGGLNQIGVSLDFTPPALWAHSQSITLQITNGMNSHLFAGDYFSIPSTLIHVLNYYDLSEQIYLEFGLTGMLGGNNRWGLTQSITETVYDANGQAIILYDENGNPIQEMTRVSGSETINEDWRATYVAGADLTISWSPLNRERFEGLTWRSEYFFVKKELLGETIQAMGAYSYLDWRLSEAMVLGVRGDVTQPFAVDNSDQLIWQGVAYLTWWQSPWVKTRLQYAHKWGDNILQEDRLVIQVVFAAGPHKHERY